MTLQKRRRKGPKGRRKVTVLLQVTDRYSLLRDAYCVIVRDGKRGRSKDTYYPDIPTALHAVYLRLLEDKMEGSRAKDLETLQQVLEETRQQFRGLLSIEVSGK